MKSSTNFINFIERHESYLGHGAAVCIALLLFYLTAPSLVTALAPELSGELWTSPLSVRQVVSILAGIVFVGILLAITNRIRSSRATGEGLAPLWLIILAFGTVTTIATAFVAIVGFGVTEAVMLSLGVESSTAILAGILMAIILLFILK